MKKLLFSIWLVFACIFASGQNLNDKWQAKINKGKTEYAVENYKTAVGYFVSAAQLVPTDSLAYNYLLDCAYTTRDVALADPVFVKLITIKKARASHYATIAALQRDIAKDSRKAISFINKGKRRYPNNENLLTEEIITYYRLKYYKKSRNLIMSFLRKHDGTEQLYSMLIWIYLKREKNLAKAQRTLDDVLMAYPDSYRFKKQQADLYIRKKQFDKAKPMLEKLIVEKPDDALNHYNLALIEFENGNFKLSAKICEKAIEADSSFVEAYYNVGTFYLFNAITYNRALNEMTVGQYQEQGEEFEFKAKENFDRAIPYLKKAKQLNPDDLDAFENYNTAFEMLSTINDNLKLKARAKMISDEMADNKDMASNIQIVVDSMGMEVCASGADCGMPAIRINKLEVVYPEKDSVLIKGQQAILKFAVQNISNVDAYDLDIVLLQTVTIPGLQHNANIKIDTLKSLQSMDFDMPIAFDTKGIEVPAIKNFDDLENKMRMFVKQPQGLSSSLVEFNLNLAYNLKAETKSETEDLVDFVPEEEIRNFLLIIGINEYQHWTPLDNAVLDARSIKDVLVSKYKFDKENVFEVYDKDANLRNIRNTLIKIRREIKPSDNLVIYYAGHGIYNEALQSGSWIPVNAQTETEKEYFRNEQLLQYLSKLETRHVFVIADACFSGALFVEGNMVSFQQNNDKISSRWGLSSGNLEEVADGTVGKNSPFAKELIRILKENTRSSLPVSELINVVKFNVKNQNAQTPVGRPLAVDGNEGGEFILYKREVDR